MLDATHAGIVIEPPAARCSWADFGNWRPWHDPSPWRLDIHLLKVTWFSSAYISIARQEKLTLPDLCERSC
jgi:hypothetical protein